RIASPACSCTGRREVQPSSWAMACWSRSGNRENTLIGRSHGDASAAEAVRGIAFVLFWRVELAPGEHRLLLGGELRGCEAEQRVGVLLGLVREQIEDVHERAQELPGHHPHVPVEALGHLLHQSFDERT